MITLTDARQYLDQAYGVALPDLVLSAAVARVAAVEPRLTAAGYAAHDIVLIQAYAVAIVACAGSPRRVSSQGAPSGASRAFALDAKALTQLRRSLAELDPLRITAAVVGRDPAGSSFLMVLDGSGHCPRPAPAPPPG